MKRQRSGIGEIQEDTRLRIWNDEQIKLGDVFRNNPANANPPLTDMVIGVESTTGFVRIAPGGGVTTGDQTFTGIKNFVPGIKLNGGQLLDVYRYLEGTTIPTLSVGAPTTFNVRGVPAVTVPWRAERIGNTVTVSIAEFQITAETGVGNSQIHLPNLLPIGYRPPQDCRGPMLLFDGLVPTTAGFIDVDTAGTVSLVFFAVPALPYGTYTGGADFNYTFTARAFF